MSEQLGIRFLRRKEVVRITGLPSSTLYERMAAGAFPRPVRLSPNIVGWPAHEVEAWAQQRITERDTAAK